MSKQDLLVQDLRTAVRVLAHTPGVTALSLISVALGIGLTAGTFSIADAMLLRPFHLERPHEVLYAVSRGEDGREVPFGWPDYLDMRDVARDQAHIVAYQRRGSLLAIAEESENVLTTVVTPDYFSMLGVEAALGKASVDMVEGRPAAVIGYRMWQRRFGGNPSVMGTTILLTGKAFVVAGVLPPEFTGLIRGVAGDVWIGTDAWFDFMGHADERQDRYGQFEIIARLKPAVRVEVMASMLDAAIRGAGKHKPAAPGAPATVLRQEFALGWEATLLGGGGILLVLVLVLFVACANVAQLRLVQAESRRREFGIRIALGAGGARFACQLIVEAALIGVAGAGLGLILAGFVTEKASHYLTGGSTYVDYGIRVDHRVLAFALAAAVISVLLAGLAPARHALRFDVAEVLKSEQAAGGERKLWQKRVLIAGQIAVSVALFGAALMLLASLRNAASVRPGFETDKKLLALRAGPGRPDPPASWCEQACEQLSGLPGVLGVTFARRLPLSGSGGGATVPVELPGQAPLSVRFNNVGGSYFSVMGTRVVAGRGIGVDDREGSALVVAISQTLARRLVGQRSPLGEWIKISGSLRQVVGVVEDTPSIHLHEETEPFVYFPFAQLPADDITLLVETAGEPALLARAVRQQLRKFDPRVALLSTITLSEHMERALSQDRMWAALSIALCALALVLTSAGLFGVVQYAVSRRTREFGVRMALGAPPSTMRWMVLADAAAMVAWGIPIGLVLLSGLAFHLRSEVLGVSPLNPALYLASVVAALLIAFAAAWFPAHRATRVDPITALRDQ